MKRLQKQTHQIVCLNQQLVEILQQQMRYVEILEGTKRRLAWFGLEQMSNFPTVRKETNNR
ncbi:MAG: hypothetical protein CL831_02530 [Crocinitomicaceae bacterium]|nr:hypothetical protein [Crocinitomicaceae bacterium]